MLDTEAPQRIRSPQDLVCIISLRVVNYEEVCSQLAHVLVQGHQDVLMELNICFVKTEDRGL